MQDPITLLLADDHPVVRKGTRELLEAEADLRVLGEASSGAEVVALAAQLRPDIVLMDMSMPDMTGVEATRRIKAGQGRVSVLVLSSYDDDAYVFAALEAGAAGYLLKEASEDELLRAVRAVAAGESVLHPSIARKVMARFSAQAPAEMDLTEDLSPRELEVLRAAARGGSNKEIARALGISPRTVQVHLGNVFSKLNVGSRTEAVLAGIRRGWVDPREL
ncbi:two component transcriptional regulator, LuxR family [Deinococcus proteolyticus MRP]|uniref:Two component transcriptional regulator, LuxR family n=1 Tax=Deinococcus proteolyticus (strain ATCC 35074 / DSM 20540 / JCM 6276 / NBRC 101906 / NCIMB 13154 / VKM Ac-1939 / CCM 2703 / MRP) TaxID=693977 RepID=F0RM36_DEIPM|nr:MULTISPECIES: response regulator transcription factor [Deinococcus]ADY25956.1 two component transcriptional regulator, LuxR family [Deinococcus proteolyticus MRP]MCY1702077.1 response regulator transcription factor [Deinococcus sp. SL84]